MMEKTVLINCSPKQKLSVSGFIMKCEGLMIRGRKEYFQLRTPADRRPILNALKTAGKVIFVAPLYVDSVPSHMLPFMKEMEAFCKENGLRLKVYAIANNGFIEGKQNEPLMRVMENFCVRSGLEWCGGIGIGGGVMLNVERIMIAVMFGLMLLNMGLRAVQGENVLEPVRSFAISLGEVLLLACGIIAYAVRLALHVNKGTNAGKWYTRIMVPSFVFILFADIFFIIFSVFQGGIFRGWFSRLQPDAKYGIIAVKKNNA
ncbi:MAG: hypothetical protein IJP78_09705 [Clostridia bacterium]|nr:hypothetical protein [Clostridia bacterium]